MTTGIDPDGATALEVQRVISELERVVSEHLETMRVMAENEGQLHLKIAHLETRLALSGREMTRVNKDAPKFGQRIDPSVKIALVRNGAKVPTYATEGAAGMDLAACISGPVTLGPGERFAFPTGIALAIPPGYEGQVRPRSGLARMYGIMMVNAPGTVDGDFRGEVHAVLVNIGDEPYTFQPGDRIAQLVIAPVANAVIDVVSSVKDLGETERGGRGFGSSGR